MKQRKKYILTISIGVIIVFTFIYNSKTEFYNKKVEFYDKNITSLVTEIKETRGTKVYLKNGDYFYISSIDYKDLKVNDKLKKLNNEIFVYRKDKQGEYQIIHNGKAIKPQETYFRFFFGL